MRISVNENGFLICPSCGRKTKTKVLNTTELKSFPLYCPQCRRQTVIDFSTPQNMHSQSRSHT